ncbi:glycosyltransferase [Candidatus Babeliales bacterium]|nr:glycosyltransferase [Candidatus Babeliales bacterium]
MKEIIKKPKIAILTLHPYNYGGILSSLKVVYDFCSKYFEPTVFFLSFDKEISAYLKGFKFTSKSRFKDYFGMNCVEIGARFSFWEPGHYSFTAKDWKKCLSEFDYFFVTSGTAIPAHPLVFLNKKFVMWVATTYEEDKKNRIQELSYLRFLLDRLGAVFVRKIEKIILRRANLTWALSSYAKKSFQEELGVVAPSLSQCGYPMEMKANFALTNLKSREENIIAVGRFDDPRKNLGMLIRVFNKLSESKDNINLYIVGPKPSDDRIKRFLGGKTPKNIIFTGLISNEKLDDLYKRSSLMLITSYQEGLGIIGLEAMSYGVPIIATDCGGTRDYIVNGKSGWLVPIDDDEQMFNKAYNLLRDNKLAEEFSIFSHNFIRNNFSYEKIYSTFREGLSKVYPELKDYFGLYNLEETNLKFNKDSYEDSNN